MNMIEKLIVKLEILSEDIKKKGLLWSFIHRVYKLPNGYSIFSPFIDLLKPSYVTISDLKIYIDKKDRAISEALLINKQWEEYESYLFKKNVRRGNVILDIGAHIGYYTLLASKAVGKNGKVYAFEPDKRNFEILKKNVRINKCNNVVLVNKAVSTKSSRIKLYISKGNTGDHRIYNPGGGRKAFIVDTIALDEYFKGNVKVDFIKMDIQGAEMMALIGARKLMKNNKKIKMITEFWPYGLSKSGYSAKEFIEELVKNKFTINELDENTKRVVKRYKLAEFEIAKMGKWDFKYLYCVKGGTI